MVAAMVLILIMIILLIVMIFYLDYVILISRHRAKQKGVEIDGTKIRIAPIASLVVSATAFIGTAKEVKNNMTATTVLLLTTVALLAAMIFYQDYVIHTIIFFAKQKGIDISGLGEQAASFTLLVISAIAATISIIVLFRK